MASVGGAPRLIYSACGSARKSSPCAASPSSGKFSSIGNSISPAPCADAIRNDHAISDRNPTRIVTQRGCDNGRSSLNTPNPITTAAHAYFSHASGSITFAINTSATTAATDAVCPSAIGANARYTAARRRSCSPSATANSHPIDGLTP